MFWIQLYKEFEKISGYKEYNKMGLVKDLTYRCLLKR